MSDHKCPCGCGTMIRRSLLACPDGWWELPPELRRAVTRGRGRDLVAISNALQWFREARGGGRA
jgi:hypothetical protein